MNPRLRRGSRRCRRYEKSCRLLEGNAGVIVYQNETDAVFEPAKESGYTCFVEEIPAAISQGETIEEAKANLLDALKLVLECQRELAEKELSPQALRETIEFAGT